MSFILDALRKSEQQRGKGVLPTVLDVPATRAATSRLPLVLGAVGALLAVNVVVLLVVLLRPAAPAREAGTLAPADTPAPAAAPAAAPAPRPAIGAAPAGAQPAAVRGLPTAAAVATTPLVRPLETEAEDAAPGSAIELPPLHAGARVTRAPADDAATPTDAALGAAATRSAAGGAAGVRSLNELPPQATAGLPRLNIDLHVYGPDAAQRFVVLNGRRYHEGDRLQEGPTLERVTPDGVVLNHRGLRFMLPRE